MENRKTYFAATIASLSSLLHCYITCVLAGAFGLISKEFQMTPLQEGWAASAIFIGALVGSSFSGILADRLGRKKSFFIVAAFFVLCSLLVLSIHSFFAFLSLRFVTGIAIGINSILAPLYLAEIAPPAKRGAFVTLFQLSLTVGTLAAYFMSSLFPQDWRLTLLLVVIPALILLCGIFFLPESKQPTQSENTSWKELARPSYRFALWLGLGISLIQQLVGINAVMQFAPKLFSEAGISNAMIPTLGLGVVNVLATLFSAFLIDRFGRRKLYLFSLVGVGLSLLSMVIGFTFLKTGMSLFSCMAYVVWFSIGVGPVTWVLISEIYPLAIRAKAISIMTFFNWGSAALVVTLFPPLVAAWGVAGACAFYAFFAAGSFFFFFRAIPETKGKSLEELSAILYPESNS